MGRSGCDAYLACRVGRLSLYDEEFDQLCWSLKSAVEGWILTIGAQPMLAKSLDSFPLVESRVPCLWLIMILELTEELVQRMGVLFRHVVFEEVCGVHNKAEINFGAVLSCEHRMFARMSIDGFLGIGKTVRWKR